MKLIIFDIDGTLLKISAQEAAAFTAAIVQHFDIVNVNTNWNTYKHQTDTGIAYEILERHLGFSPSEQQIRSVMDSYVVNLKTEFERRTCAGLEISGAVRFLENLRALGSFEMTLATGNLKKVADLKLAQLGMDSFFSGGGFSDDSHDRVEILRTAIKRATVRNSGIIVPGNIYFFGDRMVDLLSARTLGIHFIGISDRLPMLKQFMDKGATAAVTDYMDPNALIDCLLK